MIDAVQVRADGALVQGRNKGNGAESVDRDTFGGRACWWLGWERGGVKKKRMTTVITPMEVITTHFLHAQTCVGDPTNRTMGRSPASPLWVESRTSVCT